MTDVYGTPSQSRFVCPVCKRAVILSRDGGDVLPRFFPFCSERCKLIDLGAWFDADYRVPGKPDEESEDAADPGLGINRNNPGE